jgi:hypothetical protein
MPTAKVDRPVLDRRRRCRALQEIAQGVDRLTGLRQFSFQSVEVRVISALRVSRSDAVGTASRRRGASRGL